MDDAKDLLFVTTSFPPEIGAGVQRVLRLLRWLPVTGFQPTVLTTAPKGASQFPDADVLSIQGEILRAPLVTLRDHLRCILGTGRVQTEEKETTVQNPSQTSESTALTRRLKQAVDEVFKYYLEAPDNANVWIPAAVRLGMQVAQQKRFRVIYSTSPRVSAHIVAARLAQWLGLLWVMEFRDLWVANPWHASPQPWLRRRMDRALEKWLIERATVIITVSEGNRRLLASRYGDSVGQRIEVIPNGFDPVEYPLQGCVSGALPLVLLHTGIFYGGRRDITGLFQAIQALLARGNVKDEIALWIAGDDEGYATSMAARMNLASVVRDLGRVPAAQAISLQASAHILLLVESAEDTEWVLGNPTAKLYEYLGAHRPILALVHPQSIIAQVVRETRTGDVFAPDDVDGIVSILKVYLAALNARGSIPYMPSTDIVAQYGWDVLIHKVGRVLDQVA